MKATTKQITVALVILVLVIAFSQLEFYFVWETSYVPQDSREMEWMQKQLDAKGIRYRIDEENHIAISHEDKALYEPLLAKIESDHMMFSEGYWTSDKEYMKVLMTELERAGIEYRIDYKDQIRYMEHDRPRFKSIESKVDDMVARGLLKTLDKSRD